MILPYEYINNFLYTREWKIIRFHQRKFLPNISLISTTDSLSIIRSIYSLKSINLPIHPAIVHKNVGSGCWNSVASQCTVYSVQNTDGTTDRDAQFLRGNLDL